MTERNLIHRIAPLAAAVMASSASAYGVVIYSGVVNIPIPTDYNGVYLNLASGGVINPDNDADGVTNDSYTIGYSEPANWDVNFFFGGIGIAYSDTFKPFVDDPLAPGSQILNVAPGITIDLVSATRTLSYGYGGSGGPGESHFNAPAVGANPAYSAFTPGVEGYLAYVLDVGGSDFYGWMRVTLTNNGTPGTIHDWAFSQEPGFTVSQIPEPRAWLLIFAGVSLIISRRR